MRYIISFSSCPMLGLENLPVELERNLNLMRDLNSRAQDLMVTIDELGDEFFDSVKARKDAESRSSLLNDINSRFSTVKEYSDDKVQLSVQTYELVSIYVCKFLNLIKSGNYRC